MKTPFLFPRVTFVIGMVVSTAFAEPPPPDASPASAAIVRSRVAASAPAGEYLPHTEREPDLASVRSREVFRPAPLVAEPLPNQFVASLPGQIAQPLTGGVIKPLAGQVVKGLSGQSIKPLPGQIVQALPGQIVQPLPGQIVR